MSDVSPRKQLSIDWQIPPNLVSRYATNIVVQSNESEFIISFFEAHPPIRLVSDDVAAQLAQIDKLPAECVARIIVPVPKMEGFLSALNDSYQLWINTFMETGNEAEGNRS